MLIETNEYKLLAVVTAHLFVAMLVGWTAARNIEGLLLCVIVGAFTGALHTTRALRMELRSAYIALAESVSIVNRTRGLSLSPADFSNAVAQCAAERLAGKRFRFIVVSFGSQR